MNETYQKKKAHISLDKATYSSLKEIQKENGIPSISGAIEWVVREKRIGDRIEVVIKALEDRFVHKRDIPEEPILVNDEGKTPREVLKEAETKVGVKRVVKSSIYKPGF